MAVLLVSVAILHIVAAQETCGMTPRTLQEDFLGSCESLVMRLNRPAVDCNQAWLEFSGAFAGVSPENVTSRYVFDIKCLESGHNFKGWSLPYTQ